MIGLMVRVAGGELRSGMDDKKVENSNIATQLRFFLDSVI
jgi:hypothetical protein